MDLTVELNYPVDLTAPLVGSETVVRDRVSVEFFAREDVINSVSGSELSLLDAVADAQVCRGASQLASFPCENVSKQFHSSSMSSHVSVPRFDEGQMQKKAGRVPRSSSGCSKRQRIAQLEDAECSAGVDDTKDLSDKQGLYLIKCESQEKTQLMRHKNNFSGKRGDRRNFKVSMKTKYDSFSVKAGLANFASTSGGNNIFGLYGLKTDVHNITELVGDLSLDDLLDGTFKCSSLGKEKGKKPANMTENIMHSVRKACSILQLPRPAQSQNLTEIDSCSNEKMPLCPSSSASIVVNGENGDSSSTDLCSSNKDSCSKSEAYVNLLDFSFYQPKDTLEQLALPMPKDLDTLLLEVAKPIVSSRNAPDPRPTKQISRQASLPAFSWSHTFGGSYRANSDAVKFLTSRSTCQGRWVRIGKIATSVGIASDCLSKLESLTYDETLVPSYGGPKPTISENNFSSISIPLCGSELTSAAAPVKSHIPLECGGDLKSQEKVEQCPRILAAAQTLCDIATLSYRLNQDGINRWPKKPSQKVMKARRSKSNEKPDEIFAASTSSMGSANMGRSGVDQILTSKRPKLLTVESKKDLDLINGVRKGPLNCFTQKSSRSSPNRLGRDSVAETRHANAYIVKHMMPPPAKVLNKTCNGQQKVRKLMRMDWNREFGRQD